MLRPHRRALLSTALAAAITLRLKAAAAEALGTLVDAVGSVFKSPDGRDEPAQVGLPLEIGQDLSTGDRSAARVALAGGESGFILGARSRVSIQGGGPSVLLVSGNLRAMRGRGGRDPEFMTPDLIVKIIAGDVILSVVPGKSVCSTVSGRAFCRPIGENSGFEVDEGETLTWQDGSFGEGISKIDYRSGDPAVDQGMDAARLAYE